MAASAPAKDTKKTGPKPLVPPDEQFWKRYSPHHEAPLSIAGSVAVHALAFGTLILFAVYLAALFFKPNRSLPIEPVRLALSGGGGGNRNGVDGGKGAAGAADDIGEPDKNPRPGEEDADRRPELTPVEKPKVESKLDADSFRRINPSETGKALARLEDSVREKLRALKDPGTKGQGGTGSGGGKGTGQGSGEGSGMGSGSTKLTKRDKRNVRWHLSFSTAKSDLDYINKLRDMEMIIAVPVGEDKYKLLRDVRLGGKLLDEDLPLHLMKWIPVREDDTNLVGATYFDSLLSALQIRIRPAPSHLVMFISQDMEGKLQKLEREYVENVLRKKYDDHEEKISATIFDVVYKDGRNVPVVRSVAMR